jgi:DNA excision repair protein ERCC-3
MEFAKRLNYPYISGDLKTYEREKILQFFQHLSDWNVLLISRVGDVGIDLPDANVAIEISSLFGSRRQEAQRLGRILRPKEKKDGQAYDSYFYSLVSVGTQEMRYALKRQKFLIKQGYSFQILDDASFNFNKNHQEKLKYKMSSDEEQNLFLEKLIAMCYRRDNDRGNAAANPKNELKINISNKRDMNQRVYIEKKL